MKLCIVDSCFDQKARELCLNTYRGRSLTPVYSDNPEMHAFVMIIVLPVGGKAPTGIN